MNQKEIKELIDYLIAKDIAEFELERGDVKLRIKRAGTEPRSDLETRYVAVHPPATPAPPMTAVPPAPSPPGQNVPPSGPVPPQEPAASPEPPEDLHTTRSPIVGTFYEAAAPGATPLVKVGDLVEAGQVLCIVEAMKLMNEIESDVSGEIVARHVKNAEPVEYGQALFDIRVQK
jgi:acetyl-CoA carboxylase biotin carboxyl carrier protein